MTVTVRIERRDEHSLGIEGTLLAFVVDSGRKGSNLLTGRQISKVSTAQEVASDKLRKQYGDKVTVTWELPQQ